MMSFIVIKVIIGMLFLTLIEVLRMTSMNVSLPDKMKSWVEGKIDAGQYHNASEYVRDLIRILHGSMDFVNHLFS